MKNMEFSPKTEFSSLANWVVSNSLCHISNNCQSQLIIYYNIEHYILLDTVNITF